MIIKASSGRQIEALVADLAGSDLVKREAAMARLIVLGDRSIERLMRLVSSDAPPPARRAALRALEAIGNPRAVGAVIAAIADADPDIAAAAVAAARAFLTSERGALVVDRLMSAVVDTVRDPRVRLAALAALETLGPSTLKPLRNTLRNDPDPALRAAAAASTARAAPPERDAARELARAAAGDLADDPAAIRDAVSLAGAQAALPLLHRLVERLREREAAEPSGPRRVEWARARASVHLALAQRHSRLALYDLRESLESADAPLPVEFLASLTIAGDRSCLEPIAAAYTRVRDTWWRRHLAEAFRAIVARERITRRHAVVKRIEKRWKGALGEVWAP